MAKANFWDCTISGCGGDEKKQHRPKTKNKTQPLKKTQRKKEQREKEKVVRHMCRAAGQTDYS